ncbi:MAG: NAD(P)H-dependent oxidoreductase [Rubellimicrobium sp.]|nr:NAD(P)H-dependent oxidoreductase [Rubellimicrobium sp.]
MKTLLVLAHPLEDSLNAHLAARIDAGIRARGHDLHRIDLQAQGFDPVLTAAERRAYPHNSAPDAAGLQGAGAIVLVFPTWWFGLPAILKGWIDRSFLPGAAFDHSPDRRGMIPRLTGLREVLAITTLGSPALVDLVYMRRPVRRVLKQGVFGPCAPGARFTMLSLYRADEVGPERLAAFGARIDRALDRAFGQENP